MSRLQLALVLLLVPALSCAPEAPVEVPLDADERQLVDAYIRLSILEALRPDYPDSVEAVLDSLATAWDSTDVLARIDAMRDDPFRWERVYTTISEELTELQRSPDNYWKEVHRPELHAPEPAAAAPTASTPE